MSTSRQVRSKPGSWGGWLAFAGTLMLLAGVFNGVTGLASVMSDQIFARGRRSALVLDVQAWGWVHLVLGILVAVVGLFLLQGAVWARPAAVALVVANMLTQMLFLPAYPAWSLVIVFIDALVLRALLARPGPAGGGR